MKTTPKQLEQALTEAVAEHLVAVDVRKVVAAVEQYVDASQKPEGPKELAERALAGDPEVIDVDIDALARTVAAALVDLGIDDATGAKALGSVRRALVVLTNDGPNDPRTLAANISRN